MMTIMRTIYLAIWMIPFGGIYLNWMDIVFETSYEVVWLLTFVSAALPIVACKLTLRNPYGGF